MRSVAAVIGMAVLWLLMSGIYKPLTIGLGVISVLIAAWVARRTDKIDGQRVTLALSPIATTRYLVWLLGEIAKANWAVTKTILSPSMTLRQHLFRTKHTQMTDLGQTIFANSITLTPGTITVQIEDDEFLVHALNYSEGDLGALADMGARVTETETVPA